jgi:hypothetical protein
MSALAMILTATMAIVVEVKWLPLLVVALLFVGSLICFFLYYWTMKRVWLVPASGLALAAAIICMLG